MLSTAILAVTLMYVDPSPALYYGEYTYGGLSEFNQVLTLTYHGRAEMRGPYANDGGKTEYLWTCLDPVNPCEVKK